MCFTETFLKPHHHINSLILNGELSHLYRCDRAPTSAQDLSNGGVMVACVPSLNPQRMHIEHPTSLEIVSIMITTPKNHQIYVIAVYRRPQLPLRNTLSLFANYLTHLPHQSQPTVILGDFNENLTTSSSQLYSSCLHWGLNNSSQFPQPTMDLFLTISIIIDQMLVLWMLWTLTTLITTHAFSHYWNDSFTR